MVFLGFLLNFCQFINYVNDLLMFIVIIADYLFNYSINVIKT